MKKLILCMTLLFMIGFVGCNSDKNDHKHYEMNEMGKVKLECPMKCEGDKTYVEPTKKCPVCKMKLRKRKKRVRENESG